MLNRKTAALLISLFALAAAFVVFLLIRPDENSNEQGRREQPLDSPSAASPGASAGGSAPGASAGGSAPGASAGGSAPGASAGGSAPGASAGGSAPGASAGGSAPGASAGGSTESNMEMEMTTDVTRLNYSEWDVKAESVGLMSMSSNPTLSRVPSTPEDKRRLKEIYTELMALQDKGSIILERKDGYVERPNHEDGGVYIVAEADVETFDKLKKEEAEINARGIIVETTATRRGMISSKKIVVSDGTRIEYYRRRDGSLMRQAILPSDEVQRTVVGDPPDLLGYSSEDLDYLRSKWRNE